MRRPLAITLTISAALSLVAGSIEAILVRHDLPAEAFVADPADLAAVGWLDERLESVLVAPRWALTAAHGVEAVGPFDRPHLTFPVGCYRVVGVVLHPQWEGGWPRPWEIHDLALLYLDRPVAGVGPIPLYRRTDELGRTATLAGRGKLGTGLTGPEGDKGEAFRRATNRIDSLSDTTLFLIFDDPESATELEGAGAPGDSGGPLFLDHDGRRLLAGISSAGTGMKGVSQGRYGTVDLYVRVSAFSSWIDGVIGAEAPTTGWSWADPTFAPGQPEAWSAPRPLADGWPSSPAADLARDFFAAYAERTLAALEGFYSRHGEPGTDAAAKARRLQQGLREPYGPLEPIATAARSEGEIGVLAHSPQDASWISLGFAVDPRPPHRLQRLYMKRERDPREPPRCGAGAPWRRSDGG
ncbi:MAG TPA: trypsin-like serine protease [Thermoanaerobaculia bacterium]|nr:trypsin-like serine protease [Thermoanaerobaculia bacterium]